MKKKIRKFFNYDLSKKMCRRTGTIQPRTISQLNCMYALDMCAPAYNQITARCVIAALHVISHTTKATTITTRCSLCNVQDVIRERFLCIFIGHCFFIFFLLFTVCSARSMALPFALCYITVIQMNFSWVYCECAFVLMIRLAFVKYMIFLA